MDTSNYIMGDNVMLYIGTQEGFLPVGCITENPFERTTERLETTARGSGGNRSYLPGIHDYTISFNGILSKSISLISYEDLSMLQENRAVFSWRMMDESGYIAKSGTAFITSLRLESSANSWVSFSCQLSPATGGISDILVWSQNGLNIVQDGNEKIIQIK